MGDRGWLHPQSCPRSERFSTVSGDGPDFGHILISPLTQGQRPPYAGAAGQSPPGCATRGRTSRLHLTDVGRNSHARLCPGRQLLQPRPRVQPLCRQVPTLYRDLGWQVVADMRQDLADLRGSRADVCWMQVHCPRMASSWVLAPGLGPMGAGEGPAETTWLGAGARPGLDGRWRRTRRDEAHDCGGAQASCRAGDWQRLR